MSDVPNNDPRRRANTTPESEGVSTPDVGAGNERTEYARSDFTNPDAVQTVDNAGSQAHEGQRLIQTWRDPDHNPGGYKDARTEQAVSEWLAWETDMLVMCAFLAMGSLEEGGPSFSQEETDKLTNKKEAYQKIADKHKQRYVESSNDPC